MVKALALVLVALCAAGAGALLRADPFSGVAQLILQRVFSPGTRVAAGADQSIYLLDPAARRIARYERGGRLLVAFASDPAIGRLVDFALDEPRGRVLAADAAYEQLAWFPPLGRQATILPLRAGAREMPPAPGAIAVGARGTIYVSDARCACVAVVNPDGTVAGTRGHGELAQPGRLAVDAWERVFVLDRGARALKLLEGLRVTAQWTYAALGLVDAADLAIAADWLHLADPLGGRVRLMRVLPPPKPAADAPRE